MPSANGFSGRVMAAAPVGTVTNVAHFTTVGEAKYSPDKVVNGTHDEVKIQQAINEVVAAGGGVVYLYPGQYNIYATINIPKDPKIRLEGAYTTKTGYGGTTLKVHSSINSLAAIIKETGDLVADESNADHSHASHYHRLVFDGNDRAVCGLLLYNTDHTIVSDCKFTGLQYGIDGQYNGDVLLSDYAGGLRVQACSFLASVCNIKLNSHTQDWITDSWFLGSPTTHVHLIACNKIHFSNNEFNTVSGQCFVFEDTAQLGTGSINVTGGFITAGTGKLFWDDRRTNTTASKGIIVSGVRMGTGTRTKLVNEDKTTQVSSYTSANMAGGYVDPNFLDDVIILNGSSGAVTLRLPLAIGALKPVSVKAINIANTVTIVPSGSDQVEQKGTLASVYTFAETNEAVTLAPDGNKWRVIDNHVPSLMSIVQPTTMKVVEIASTPYTVAADVDVLLVNAASAQIDVTLPAKATKYAAANKTLTVKVIANTNPVTVTRTGSDEIDASGRTSITISDQSAVTFVANSGSRWRTFKALTTADTIARKYAADIGNGSATSIAVTHNLNTLDVQVAVYVKATGIPVTPASITLTNTNTVTLTFGSAPGASAYRAVIIG